MSAKSLSLAKALMKRPKKDSKLNSPVVDPTIEPNAVAQADLLFLPNDNGFKYALVVVDIGSRAIDAEPLRSKKAIEVKSAFQTIFQRGTIKMPVLIQVDDGTEFKGAVIQYFKENNVMMRQGKPNRHRQQSIVERNNATIARAVFTLLHAREIETGETQREWTADLPTILEEMNKRAKKNQSKRTSNLKSTKPDLRCEGDSCKLLEIGTAVYVISDQPTEYTGIKLKGKHRATDLRWDPTPRKVTDIVLRPYQPPMYRVSGLQRVLYTRNQLQVI